MIHYSCDRCHRAIDPSVETRYLVKIEIQAMVEESDDSRDDRDHLVEIHEILSRQDEFDDEHPGLEVHRKLVFDLCPECHHHFLAKPVGAIKRLPASRGQSP